MAKTEDEGNADAKKSGGGGPREEDDAKVAHPPTSSSAASAASKSFFSKLFLLAFVGLSLAIGLREDAMGDDPMAKSDGLGVGTDARSMGDKIHISFCQS
jgi:hypothetical protein